MEVATTQVVFDLDHDADVGAVRRRLAVLANEVGLDESRTSDAALIATELCTNVLKHARHGGAMIATAIERDIRGVSIAVWDRGPGMDLDVSRRDGVSTTGTAGVGLGAISRLASTWDAYSFPGAGTVITATVFARAEPERERVRAAIGGVCVPYPGLPMAGDGWDAHVEGDTVTLIVSDGLGHGEGAAKATEAVLEAFRKAPADTPAAILDRAHRAARGTRGAAATVVRLDLARRLATTAGVGNVMAWICGEEQRQLVTQHGTLGQTSPRIREESYPFPQGAVLVVHSDGLKTRWDLSALPGIRRRQPTTIATALWRDLARGRDDATVVVVTEVP